MPRGKGTELDFVCDHGIKADPVGLSCPGSFSTSSLSSEPQATRPYVCINRGTRSP